MSHLDSKLWVAAVGTLTLACAPVVPDDCPQWGERLSRNMMSAETGLPDRFDPATGEHVRWSVALGTQTYSSPVIGGGRVLIGTNNGAPRDARHQGDRGVLMCFAEQDGSFLWQLVVPKRSEDPYLDWPHVGMVSPATIEGDRAYMVDNRGNVLCLDLDGLADGNDGPFLDECRYTAPKGEPALEIGPLDADIVWQFDMEAGAGVHQHDAAHCSILLHGPFLYACTSNGVDNTHLRIPAPDAPCLVVLEKATGRLVGVDAERIGPRIIHSTWASPSLGVVGGRELVFFGAGDAAVYAFEALRSVPSDGTVEKLRRVWRFDCDPEAPKENVHDWQDDRSPGTPSNLSGMPVLFDGRVAITVGGDVWHGKREAWLKCIDASGSGDITESGEIWSYPLERHSMSTPSVRDGLVTITDCGGKIHCLDARDGRAVWVHDAGGEMWGSTLLADGKVYAGTRRGDFWVLAASREKRVLSRVDLESAIHSTPVAANGVLYVATMRRLYALSRSPAAVAAAATPSPAPTPKAVDLRPLLEKWGLGPRVQGSRGTCSAFVVTGAIEFALAKGEGRGTRLSVEFLNWASNRAIGKDQDGGFFSDLWKGFEAHGLCAESELPYRAEFQPDLAPSSEARERARDALAEGLRLRWIKEWDPKRGLTDSELAEVKRVIALGWPVCGGFLWPKQESWVEGVLQFRPRNAVRDGHSVLLVGFRDDSELPGGGVFIVRNTAGRGRDGFLTYEYLKAYMNDAAWIAP